MDWKEVVPDYVDFFFSWNTIYLKLFRIFSIICKYCLSVNTAFEADELSRAVLFGFQCRCAGTHMVLLYVQLSEAAFETCYNL